jgi:hypothetical protein
MRTPIVLVKLSGVQRLIPFEKFIPRHRGVITVKFGEPKQFCATMSLEQATQELQDALEKL